MFCRVFLGDCLDFGLFDGCWIAIQMLRKHPESEHIAERMVSACSMC